MSSNHEYKVGDVVTITHPIRRGNRAVVVESPRNGLIRVYDSVCAETAVYSETDLRTCYTDDDVPF